MNASLTTEYVAAILTGLDQNGMTRLRQTADGLTARVAEWFNQEEVPEEQRRVWWSIGTRYFGQNYELTLPIDLSADDEAFVASIRKSFHIAHEANYGFASESEPIQIVNVAVKAIGELEQPALPILAKNDPPEPVGYRETLFALGELTKTPVFERDALVNGQCIHGPAIIEQMDTTVLIFPDDTCNVDRWGNLVIELGGTHG